MRRRIPSSLFGAAARVAIWVAGVSLMSMGCATGGRTAGPGVDANLTDGGGLETDGGGDPLVCGNGILDPGEGCDDGNQVSGDGCSAACQLESCDASSCPLGCCDSSSACLGGAQDTACGSGGQSCQDCAGAGLVCVDYQCQDLGSCTPGEQAICGNCGTRTCVAGGLWGPCEGEGPCVTNQVEVGGGCENCGHQERTCDGNCQWGSWTCVDQLACSPGQVDVGGSCTNCGHDERTCSGNCQWGTWTCVDQGVCSPNTYQNCNDCGRQQCSGACQWGSCQGFYACGTGETCNSSGWCEVTGCPCGNGDYCGGPVGLDPLYLYNCQNGSYAQSSLCGAGCHASPCGQADYCEACTCGDGTYCGGPFGLSSNTLYWCQNGVFTVHQSCASGCYVAACGQADYCL